MAKNDTTSAIIDGLLKFMVAGGLIATVVVTPNAVQALDKPLKAFFDKMDERQRQREWRRILVYMQKKRLVTKDYEHGIGITEAGRQRAEQADFDQLTIKKPARWDKKWRVVLYDIPERLKVGRNALTAKLRHLGFYQLQRSVWVHPFPCHKEIEAVTLVFGVEKYVSYLETGFIDKQKLLIKKFHQLDLSQS